MDEFDRHGVYIFNQLLVKTLNGAFQMTVDASVVESNYVFSLDRFVFACSALPNQNKDFFGPIIC